ncbi:hypothetical protein D0809_16220 [Flavobacterium circumlabens]|uniref:Uncharacterized protein n=1 Tax=Flavobacterium circumlabens TaxID=2133765 RepID=A0A4Y7U976_9FLAO|nr:hypothetical protein [Flavobacterium circumlabens]TCN55614.1 hypothetical protein EV142_106306 [Flavobacterium circumlabens]TEB42985.1 hypothetical protein D0809_16220 [Flavobacterium circumlabens]
MLLRFKEQIIEDFLIPSFTLNEGEIVIIEIPNGVEFQKISLRLIEIITELCSEIKYAEHFKENSFLNKLFPVTIGGYLKGCNENSIYKNKIYEIEWIKPKIKVNSIAGRYRRLLSLYKTLTFTKNIIIDLVGVDPFGGVEIFKILKQNRTENGSVILFDSCNEFEKDCTNFIRAKYMGTDEKYKDYNETMADK